MSYLRVIPRDLFNEAKLLKCLGQLALIIHDGVKVPRGLSLSHFAEDEGFRIEQNPDSGALYCSNMECAIDGAPVELSTPYNSKDAYPLRYRIDDDTEGRVFDDEGKLSDEFISVLEVLK